MQYDFFISYTSADKSWAVWIAQQLEKLGYSVLIQEWTFQDGPAVVYPDWLSALPD